MKKKVVKITLIGYGGILIVDFTESELGRCCYYLEKYKKIVIEVSEKMELPCEKYCVSIVPLDEFGDKILIQANFIPISKIGNFENHIEPGNGDEFLLELTEMDEKELDMLPDFEGW